MFGKKSDELENIVVKHFDILSEQYDKTSLKRKKYNDSINEIVKQFIDGDKYYCILDVGCGTGTRARELLKTLDHYEYYGCDISTKMIAKATQNGLSNISYGDVTNLQYENGKFDIVLCLFNVLGYLHHESDILKALSELSRVVKDDGVIFIDVMNQQHVGEKLQYKKRYFSHLITTIKSYMFFGKPYGQLFKLSIDNKQLEGYVRGFRAKEIKRLVSKANLEIIKSHIVGYDSGQIHSDIKKGQIFLALMKRKFH